MDNEKEFILIDVCLPDYFRGHSNLVFSVPVDGSTTWDELKELLEHELYCYEINEQYNGFNENELDKCFNKFLDDNNNLDNKTIIFPELIKRDEIEEIENDGDYYENCHAYFTVM